MQKAKAMMTALPTASQIFNLDEKKGSVNPGANSLFTLGRRGKRAFHTVTGERDLFQASILDTACADGRVGVIPPMVVHAGGTEETMPAHYACGLPSNCLVHSNASGYMDKDGVKAYMLSFKQNCGVSLTYPVFLFLDGHESHFDAEAHRYLNTNNINTILIRANNSTNDQPLDMGPNSHFDSIYKEEGINWRDLRPNVPLTIQYYNSIFATTWQRFVNDPRTAEIVKSAFARAKLFPVLEDISSLLKGTTPQEIEEMLYDVVRSCQVKVHHR